MNVAPAGVSRSPALWLIFLLGSLVALPFALSLALGNSRSHDEHQHIAAGVLLARDGLLPYRDFAYFHVPYLVYVYGLLFALTDHYLLASRVFSAVCAALTCGAIAGAAWALFADRSWLQRSLVSIGALAVLISTPLFYDTVGHSWNQEPSVLLAVLAFLCHLRALESGHPGRLLVISGLLTGCAIGMRVTLAPLVLPFAVMLWIADSPARLRIWYVLLFAVGIALALVPAAWAFLSAPEGFIFANIEFPQVNITYRFATGEPRTMTLAKKMRFLFKEVMRPNWLLFFGFIATWGMVWLSGRARWSSAPRLFRLVLLTLPFFFLGALAPSPAFDQYFYPLAPILVLATLSLVASVPRDTPWLRWGAGLAAALVLASSVLAAPRYEGLADLFSPQEWNPTKMRVEAAELRRIVPQGRVLTLAPTLPLEAGLQIYPQFATGPFAWRVARFVPRERRAELQLTAPEDLTSLLVADLPVAVMTGFEKRWEKPLEQFAREHGYRRTVLADGKVLWIAP